MNVGDVDVLIPVALVFADGEPQGASDELALVEVALGKLAHEGGDDGVRQASGCVVARPASELLQTDEALQDEAAFGFLGRHLHEVAESHDTVILCEHDSLLFEFETVGKGIGTMIPW